MVQPRQEKWWSISHCEFLSIATGIRPGRPKKTWMETIGNNLHVLNMLIFDHQKCGLWHHTLVGSHWEPSEPCEVKPEDDTTEARHVPVYE